MGCCSKAFCTFDEPISYAVCHWQRHRRPALWYAIYRSAIFLVYTIFAVVAALMWENYAFDFFYGSLRTVTVFCVCYSLLHASYVLFAVVSGRPGLRAVHVAVHFFGMLASDLFYVYFVFFFMTQLINVRREQPLSLGVLALYVAVGIFVTLDFMMVEHSQKAWHFLYVMAVQCLLSTMWVIYVEVLVPKLQYSGILLPMLPIYLILIVCVHVSLWGMFKVKENIHRGPEEDQDVDGT